MKIYGITEYISKVVIKSSEFFCITSEDGMGIDNPRYYFFIHWKSIRVARTSSRGMRVYVSDKIPEFHAVGVVESSQELHDFSNTESFYIGDYKFFCPKIYKFRLQEKLNISSIEMYMNFKSPSSLP